MHLDKAYKFLKFYVVFVAFENLTKAFEKAKRVIDKEGLPHFFIRHLAELEDFTAEVRDNWMT